MENVKVMEGFDRSLWEEPIVKRWLDSIVKEGTKYGYKCAFKAYMEYTKLSPEQLIDEAVEDSRKDPRQRRDVLLTKILGFYAWLKTDYVKKSRGTGPHRATGKGLSDKLASMYTAAVRSFYATYDLTIRLRGRRRLPKARLQNKRMIVGAEQVKVLYDHARTPRDRAIILTNFQGGLDASTLCSIKYGDVAEGIQKNQYPLKLELQRPKTGTDFYTFLGKDAVEALKAYLADMKQRGVEFTYNTPLFLQNKKKVGMLTDNIQDMMREVALRAGFIDDKNNGHDFNPLGPHALRESFGSIMTNSGVPDTVVDFWLGHEIGEMSEAYKSVQFENVREMYVGREKLLAISAPKVDVDELKEKLKVEVEQQYQGVTRTVAGLATENLELRSKVSKLEMEHNETRSRMQRAEQEIIELKKMLREMVE